MYQVGTNAGRVHDQKQGTGLGTVLQGDRAVDTYERLTAYDLTRRQKKADELAASRDAILKYNPERWFKHEQSVQKAVNDWHAEGTRILAGGRDPWKSVDPESLRWRQKQVEIQGLALASQQLQSDYEKVVAKMNAAEPDEYTPESWQAIQQYLEKDIAEVALTGEQMPVLEKQRPMLQLQDYFSKVVGAVNQTMSGNTWTDRDRWQVVRQTLGDPDKADDLQTSFNSAFRQMDPEDVKALDRRANAAGVSRMEQAAYEYVTRYETQRKPFDYGGWKSDALKRVEVPYNEWRGADKFSKTADEKELMRSIRTIAADAFNNDDRAMREYEEVLPRKKNEVDGDYRKRAIAHLAAELRQETVTSSHSGVTDRGADGAELTASRNLWLPDMYSKDLNRENNAAGYLFQTGDMLGNMTITDATVIPVNPMDPASPRLLIVDMQGSPSLKDIKTTLGDDEDGARYTVDQRGTYTKIQFPVTPENQNFILSMHDKSFDQKKKTPYGGIQMQDNRPTASSVLAGFQTAGRNITPPPATKAKNRF